MPEFATPAFMRIRTGLLEAKHVRAMGGGSPLVIYLYLQSRVRFRGEHAGVTWEPYTHAQAAADLGLSARSVESWFQTLERAGYIEVRKLQRGLEVRITKYGQESPETTPESVGTDPPRVRPGAESEKSRLRQPTGLPTPPMRLPTPANVVSDASIKEARALQENKRTRESPPPSPPTWQAEVVEAFEGVGLPAPDLDGNEGINARKLLKHTTPEMLAMCWQEIRAGEYGDETGWLQRNLSFVTLAERQRFTNWLMEKAGKSKPPPKRNGRVYAGPGMVAAYHEQRGTFDGTGTDPGRGRLGGGQTQPRLSGQLP